MSTKPDFDPDKAHRWFGVTFNNGIFPLLIKENRSEEETEEMIAMAFAATLHWSQYSGCKYANKVRGVNMIVTSLSYAGRKESSLFYAEKNHSMVMDNLSEVEDFDISYMYMQYARSLALNGNMDEAKKYYDKCLSTIEEIKDKEDKDIVVSDLNSGPWYSLK